MSSPWEIVIGLETHVQLSTASKMFSDAPTAFGAAPNTQASAVDLALPGALPVANRAAVERAIRLGLAVGATIAPVSVFARKNYFYPDLPKGYQISQFEIPVVQGGHVPFLFNGAVRQVELTRAHLEEDAGKSVHGISFEGQDATGIDLNRAGTPLLEVVSEPVMRSAAEAAAYARALHALVVWLDICDGNLQEGSFRCDANVSVMRKGATQYGTRAEIKNMNSFRYLKQAVDYEARRQVELVEAGQPVVQETRLYDPARGETRSMRSKEEAHDYRYFPEPDLPPVRVGEALVARMRAEQPELPRARAARYQGSLGLSAQDAGVLVGDGGLADFFDAALSARGGGAEAAKKVANWLIGELSRLANETGLPPRAWKLTPARLAEVLGLLDAGTVNGAGAKLLVEELFRHGGDPAELVRRRGLAQVSDEGAIEAAVDAVLAASPAEVERHRSGKKDLTGFFVGQVMKALKGKGNPGVVNALLKKKLGGG